jgi:hypothetical protein
VDGKDSTPPTSLLDPDHGIGRQPVVGVNNIEGANDPFCLEQMMDEGAAHAVDFIHKIRVQIERTPVIPDSVNLLEW